MAGNSLYNTYMTILTILSNAFGVICVVGALLVGAVAFAAFNENDDHFSATVLALVALLLLIGGSRFFGPVN